MKQLMLFMRARGIQQRRLARAIGVSDAAISRYLSGDRKPDIDTIRAIADYLGLEPAEVCGEVPIMTDDERQFLALFRAIPESSRPALLKVAEAMAAPPTPPKKVADPEK